MSGADFFKAQSKEYSRFRPEYPRALFEYISSLAPTSALAWDFACGTGQAARGLAPFFEKVLATDASPEQLAEAELPKNVTSLPFNADHGCLEEIFVATHSVDTLCVAQAVHWFAHDRFFEMAKSALKPNAAVVVWGYGVFKGDPALERLVEEFSNTTLGSLWSAGNRVLVNGYKDLYFPLTKLPTPRLQMKAEWNADQILGYLSSWSATQKFKDTHGADPLLRIEEALREIVGDRRVPLLWDLTVLAGKV